MNQPSRISLISSPAASFEQPFDMLQAYPGAGALLDADGLAAMGREMRGRRGAT